MRIFPAIDLYEGKAVRLFKGDYSRMTVYSGDPVGVAKDFESMGAEFLHVVDLEGAKDGLTYNYDTIKQIVDETDLFVEVGGGIRSMAVVDAYLSAGVGRVILGTAAVNNRPFLQDALARHGEQIAVGVDVLDGHVMTRGWTEDSKCSFYGFCREMQELGVKTLICTDVSKDGAMQGTNMEMFRKLSEELKVRIVASGGISSMDDIRALREMNIYAAIIGKAYYIGAIDIKEAIEASR